MIEIIFERLHALPRVVKKALMVGMDLVLIPFALWLSLSLRLGEIYADPRALFLFVAVPFFTIPVFIRLGLYRAVMRYVGKAAMQQVFTGVVVSAGIVLALTLWNWPNGLPRSTFAIYGFVAFALLGAARLLARAIFGGRMEWRGKHVAVYGAGASGRQLVGMLRAGHEYRPVLFLDDNRQLINQEIEGLRVYAPTATGLAKVLKRLGVVAIFLAMPSIPRAVKRKILRRVEDMPFHVYTIPDFNEIVAGTATINQLREIPVEDLLGRNPIPPNDKLLGRCVQNRRVLVTGAGGSIGSELCRQLIELRPDTLVLLDNSEFSLFSIDNELRGLIQRQSLNLSVVPILGDVCDRNRVEEIIRGYNIETIYHAAAYKHVPIVERNPIEGVKNNVFGTVALAEVAKDNGVKDFVLISTDKAVRPTNVMGASKRLAEMVLQNLSRESDNSTFSMVRFGNVLGSSGSVVPLFRKQIADGGPITVTHPEITRYFMTVAEAVQLVIQAGAMAEGGDVFVLDMGEPIKIFDLARQMVHLSGLEIRDENNPHGEIEIHYSGLRPGEKLYEELLIGNDVSGTEHVKILRAQESCLTSAELHEVITDLRIAIIDNRVDSIRAILKRAIKGYRPNEEQDNLDVRQNVLQLSRR